MDIRNIVTVAYFVLAIYGFGGGVMSGVVYYPSWKLVSAEDLPAVHKYAVSHFTYYFLPFVYLLVLVNILLIWFSPSSDVHTVDRNHGGSSPFHLGRQPYAFPAYSQPVR